MRSITWILLLIVVWTTGDLTGNAWIWSRSGRANSWAMRRLRMVAARERTSLPTDVPPDGGRRRVSSSRSEVSVGDVHALMRHSDEGVTACGGLDPSLWRRRVYR